jgi:diaminopimelate decarboxylase
VNLRILLRGSFELPETRRGDILAIRSAGAYGEVMASRYNLRDLPRVVFSDEI